MSTDASNEVRVAADSAANRASRAASSVAGPPPAGESKGRRKGLSERNRPLWMLIPGGALMFIIIVVPLVLGIYMSTLNLDQYTLRRWISSPFIGVENFVEALTSSPLLHATWLSVSYSLLAMVVTLPLGIAAAVATQNAFRGRAVVRSIFLIPYVLPSFVVATIWRTMFQPDGIVDKALGTVGIETGLWLNGPQTFWTLVLVQIWASWPFIYLLALSGLQSVDHEVHEASALDGALWWNKLRYVIFPYLKGPLALAFLIGMLHHINNFTLPFVLFGVPAPADVEVLPILTYVTSFQSFRFGLSAAMAFVSLVLIAIPLFVYLRAVKLDDAESPGAKK
ncbi:multiple sugar transport system permease protein [Arthrobacter sp. PvP102]|jgi:multiple sugar transport system permease protein|uniref:carbohydrate ABC transporter permease n=1 Tax=unclassified Arthrobacter TaxID=235627 RepID=UPI001AE149E1|nr:MULTISPECIES: sugar ABC transporter permease [unclassified Arthrobacter]MBP1234037.1 multiple sugar transport system permease protein [Arthrobacter sp. PvP103]MBP1239171.1 multiple sugar transport system permease protein [Arthrobacter sp. PvP102]